MLDYVDVTPLIEPIIRWEQYVPYEPSQPARESLSAHTSSAHSKDERFQLFGSRTGIYAPTSIPDTRLARSSPRASTTSELSINPNRYSSGAGSESESDRIAKQRVRLLAAKYTSSKVSTEIVARLEILNQRLLDRSPRVSQSQVEALEGAIEKLARIRSIRENRSRRLGIAA